MAATHQPHVAGHKRSRKKMTNTSDDADNISDSSECMRYIVHITLSFIFLCAFLESNKCKDDAQRRN